MANVIEVAANERNQLKLLAEALEKELKELNERKLELTKDYETYYDKKRDYRVKSVIRVIDFIAYHVELLEPNTISTLLVHCLNKLNGHIDGTELVLKFDKEQP